MAEFYDFYQRNESTGAVIEATRQKFTDGEEAVSGYTPKKFARSAIVKSGKLGDNEATLQFSIEDDFAKSRLLRKSEDRYWVEIRQTAGATNPFWRGKMKLCNPSRNQIRVMFTALLGSLRIYGLPTNYQRTCRHSLYDSLCKVPTTNNFRDVIITKISGREQIIEVEDPNKPASGDGDWELEETERGYLEQNSVNYRIVRVSGMLLYLTRVTGLVKRDTTASPPVTGTATIYRGCDKKFSTCKDRFDNRTNFGGFPYLSPWEYWGSDLTKFYEIQAED